MGLVGVSFIVVCSTFRCNLAQTAHAFGELLLVDELGIRGRVIVPFNSAGEENQSIAPCWYDRRILRVAQGDLTAGYRLDQESRLRSDLRKVLLNLGQGRGQRVDTTVRLEHGARDQARAENSVNTSPPLTKNSICTRLEQGIECRYWSTVTLTMVALGSERA